MLEARKLARYVAIVVLMAASSMQAAGCGSEAGTGIEPADKTTSAAVSQTVTAFSCATLSHEDLDKLVQLQQGITYDVLVPSCLPAGFHIDANSISKRGPLASGSAAEGKPDYMKRPSYGYSVTDGSRTVQFEGNTMGDPGIAAHVNQIIHGHKALIYFQTKEESTGKIVTVPFEKSSFYRVLWLEGADIEGQNRYGAYYAYSSNMSWEKLAAIIESMKPVNGAAT